jgi:oligopeptide/dipeptide ABC transporter ATP-binding protein
MITRDTPLLSVRGLTVQFPSSGPLFGGRRHVHAVNGVDFDLHPGQTLGLVGESGCGKTTVGRAMLQLLPSAHVTGQVAFDGADLLTLSHQRIRPMRRRLQMIFQDPAGSLNPRITVRSIVAEPMSVHRMGTRREITRRVDELLERVGLPSDSARRYPHEFSGGQRQRIGIARAIAPNPDIIICDEPVSALDVSVQAQILNLLKDLQQDMGLSYLFIAHNLAVVKHFADEVAVMYLGRIVERATSDMILQSDCAHHPYTQSLIDAIPIPDPTAEMKRELLSGEPPSPITPPTGCTFHPRCPLARQLGQTLSLEETRLIPGDEGRRIPSSCASVCPTLQAVANVQTHQLACPLVTTP